MIQNKQKCWAAIITTTTIGEQNNKRTPDAPPKGSWQTKVPLGCAIS